MPASFLVVCGMASLQHVVQCSICHCLQAPFLAHVIPRALWLGKLDLAHDSNVSCGFG